MDYEYRELKKFVNIFHLAVENLGYIIYLLMLFWDKKGDLKEKIMFSM